MSTTDKLLNLKKEIDRAKTQVTALNTKKELQMKDLKDNWKCTTLAQAEKKVKELEKEIKELTTQIREGTAAIEEKYEL